MKTDPRSIVTLEDVRRWLVDCEERDSANVEAARAMARTYGALDEYEHHRACTAASIKVLTQAISDIKKVTVLEGVGPMPWKPEPLAISRSALEALEIDRPFEESGPGDGTALYDRMAEARAPVYDQVWRVRTRLPGRLGTACRVLKRGRMNSILVEFESDKYQVITSRNYVRARKDKPR